MPHINYSVLVDIAIAANWSFKLLYTPIIEILAKCAVYF